MTAERRILLVIAVDVDDMPLDCCDDDRVHVWLWTPEMRRRAFITQGTPFVEAAGLTVDTAQQLDGMDFWGELEIPSWEPRDGEHIEVVNLQPCPPIGEVMDRLNVRMKGGSQ